MSPGQTKEAVRARNKLWTEIWAGRVDRADTCERCGFSPEDQSLIHAHHDDYSKPLDVRWLCNSCHQRHHMQILGRLRIDIDSPIVGGSLRALSAPKRARGMT